MTITALGRARVAFAVAASEVSDYARDLVGDVAAPPAHPGALLRQVRLLRVADLTLLDRAVIVERLSGASWDDIADALSLPVDETIRRHAETCDLWAAAGADDGEDWTVGLARDLDAWHARGQAPWSTCVDAPVTRAL